MAPSSSPGRARPRGGGGGGDDQDVYARRFDASGAAVGGDFAVATVSYKIQSAPAIASDNAGNFVIVWQSQDLDYNDGKYGIYAQRFNASGVADVQGQIRVNTTTPDEQRAPTVAMAGNGDFVVAWQALRQDNADRKEGVYGQRYTAAGTAVGGEFLINTTTVKAQTAPSVAMADDGRIIATWTSEEQDGSGLGIFAQRFIDVRSLVFAVGDGTDDPIITVTGTQGQINDVLDGLIFTPAPNFDGAAQIDILVDDLGNSGAGGAKTSTGRVRIDVTAVNDRPTISVPPKQTVVENTPIVFSAAAGRALLVGDPDAANKKLLFTLKASVGTMTMSTTNGLQFVTGTGNGDALVSFRATVDKANLAFDGLQLMLPANFTGAASITVAVDDEGNVGLGGALSTNAALLIDVVPDGSNAAPVVQAPAPQRTPVNTPLVLAAVAGNGLTIVDDAANNPVRVTVTVSNGTATLSQTIGAEFNVNSVVTVGDQREARVAALPGGGAVVIWTSNGGGGGSGPGDDLVGQRFDASGNRLGPEFFVNSTVALAQNAPDVAANSSGAFAVAWVSKDQDGSGTGIYLQRYDAAGNRLGGETLVNTSINGDQTAPSIALADDGSLVVAWQSADGNGQGVFVQRFDANGQLIGGETQVNQTISGDQEFAAVATDAGGNFVVVWQGQDADREGILARRFDAAGNALGGEFVVNSSTSNAQETPTIAMNASGAWVVGWLDGNASGSIAARRFDASGNPLGAQFQVNTGSGLQPSAPAAAINPSGQFVVSWQAKDADRDGIYAQAHAANGTRIGVEQLVNTRTADDQFAPSVAMAGDGTYRVVWTGDKQDGADAGIASQRMLLGNELSFSVGDGMADATFTFSGTLQRINAALDAMVFTPTAGFNGIATLQVAVDDLGSTGSGGAKAGSGGVTIMVGNGILIDLDANNSSGALGSDFRANFRSGLGAVLVADIDASISDNNKTNLLSMTVRITNLLDGANEVLSATTGGTNVVASYNAGTGTLTLSGSDLVAKYQQVLRTLRYNNLAASPNTALRTISVVANDGLNPSNTAYAQVSFDGVSAPPLAANDSFAAIQGQTLVSAAGALLANDSDPGANPLTAVKVSDPVNGILVLRADGSFDYTPTPGFAGIDSFTYRASNGVSVSNTASVAINVARVNSAPTGSAITLTIAEDQPRVIAASDFGYSDAADSPADGFAGVTISSLPAAGSLTLAGVAVTSGNFIGINDINAGRLVFAPAANQWATAYAQIGFRVHDDGGTANGGIDTDPTVRQMRFDVTSSNDAPAGADKTVVVAEDGSLVFGNADFGFSDSADSPANSLLAVRIVSLPTDGVLKNNGTAVVASQFISAADIAAGRLVYTPAPDGFGTAYASFTFQVRDDGGTAGGGIDIDPTPNTITIDVTGVNDAPVVVTSGGSRSYTENQAAIAIDNALTLSDIDSATLASATVRISANYSGNQDVLAFSNQLGITGSWNSATGVLSLAGTASVADYQTALRSVAYFNSSDDPSTSNRIIAFTVNDGAANSATANKTVTVAAVVDHLVTVDTTNDTVDGVTTSIDALLANRGSDGKISLREAIAAANNTVGLDTINFNFSDSDTRHYYYRNDGSSGSLSTLATTTLADAAITDFDVDYPYAAHSWFRIDLNAALPQLDITSPLIIDGYSQAGASVNTLAVGDNANIRIELTNTGADNNRGLTLLDGSDGSTIRGLAINRFTWSGILIDAGADGNTIVGNFLGTDITGTIALGNGDDGLQVRSSNNLIGGADPAARNLISGNSSRGINFFTASGTADNNTVQNNYIGVDATGSQAVGNAMAGIQGYNLANSSIAGNLISGNSGHGIWLRTSTTTGNTIQSNLIGANAAGSGAIANGSDGILLEGNANSNLIGGINVGAGNTIAYNAGRGVNVVAATNVAIVGNSIFGNAGGLGIDLLGNNVTANDAGDGDSGPNNLQNFPVLSSALVSTGSTFVAGSLNSTAATAFRIEFFSSPTGDASGFGEGKVYLGFVNVTTNTLGNASFNAVLGGVSVTAGHLVSATATVDLGGGSLGSSSEFAANVTASIANSAPALDASRTPLLQTMDEDAGAPVGAVGTLVSSLVDFAAPIGQVDNVTDSDAAAQLGIAVVAADITKGSWWYSLNDGASWNSLGSVSMANARLLSTDAGVRVAFQPNANYSGTLAAAITFHAWDRSSGASGGVANLTQAQSTLDQFGVVAYSNNYGSANWNGSWIETDTAGGAAASGNIQVSGGQLVITGNAADSVYRSIDLSGALTATLSLDFQTLTATGIPQVDLEVSGNGGASYTMLQSFWKTSPGGSGSLNFDISAYIGSDTRIRFKNIVSVQPVSMRFDNVQVSYTTALTGGVTAFSATSDTAALVVNPVNDAPAGANQTVSTPEDTAHTFVASNFGFSDTIDSPANALLAVKISSLPAAGSLTLAGAAVSAGQFVSATDIAAGKLKFTPAADANGAAYASFTFQVQDDGGTARGGIDLDATPNTITIDVSAVNDPPVITSNGGGSTAAVSVAENTSLVTTVSATDIDSVGLVYSIAGGADAARFTINPTTGVLNFATPPNFEAPSDVGADNVYNLTVAASDGSGGLDTQALAVTVTDVLGAPGAATASLWFTTGGNQSTAAGGLTWTTGQVLQYGNAGDRFDLDGNLTSGTVDLLAGFATTVPVRAMHYVQTAITIGSGAGIKFNLNPGDLLLVLDPGAGTVSLNGGALARRPQGHRRLPADQRRQLFERHVFDAARRRRQGWCSHLQRARPVAGRDRDDDRRRRAAGRHIRRCAFGSDHAQQRLLLHRDQHRLGSADADEQRGDADQRRQFRPRAGWRQDHGPAPAERADRVQRRRARRGHAAGGDRRRRQPFDRRRQRGCAGHRRADFLEDRTERRHDGCQQQAAVRRLGPRHDDCRGQEYQWLHGDQRRRDQQRADGCQRHRQPGGNRRFAVQLQLRGQYLRRCRCRRYADLQRDPDQRRCLAGLAEFHAGHAHLQRHADEWRCRQHRAARQGDRQRRCVCCRRLHAEHRQRQRCTGAGGRDRSGRHRRGPGGQHRHAGSELDRRQDQRCRRRSADRHRSGCSRQHQWPMAVQLGWRCLVDRFRCRQRIGCTPARKRCIDRAAFRPECELEWQRQPDVARLGPDQRQRRRCRQHHRQRRHHGIQQRDGDQPGRRQCGQRRADCQRSGCAGCRQRGCDVAGGCDGGQPVRRQFQRCRRRGQPVAQPVGRCGGARPAGRCGAGALAIFDQRRQQLVEFRRPVRFCRADAGRGRPASFPADGQLPRHTECPVGPADRQLGRGDGWRNSRCVEQRRVDAVQRGGGGDLDDREFGQRCTAWQ